MKAHPTSLADVMLFKPKRFSDSRGYFMESFRSDVFQKATGRAIQFVQENQSLSTKANTIRGLHYQAPPQAQGKLVRCIQGAILDVAVDIRLDSPNYGQSVTIELSAANDYQLWVPEGFLHGFRTLEDDTIVNYKCTTLYSPDHEGAILWNDPALKIDWGVESASVMSSRDSQAALFSSFETPFKFEPLR